MKSRNNFFRRALNAIAEGRARQTQRLLAQYERDHMPSDSKVNRL